jgi:hypothetical protein
MKPDDDPDRLLTLNEAAAFIPGAGAHTLRAEHQRGRLAVYRIGRRVYTTPRDVEEMIKRCRVHASPHASGSTKTGAPGASSTARAKSARDALGQILGSQSKR